MHVSSSLECKLEHDAWMLISALKRLLFRPSAEAHIAHVQRRIVEVEVAVAAPLDLDQAGPIPVYPPSDGGIAVVDPATIVASQSEIIDRLRKHVAVSPQDFETFYQGPINRLAGYVGLLPASKSSTHSGAGGLFRFALAMGFGCARAADGVHWSDGEPIEQKRAYEQAWRQAAFIAGICSELYRPLIEMHVFTQNGQQWGPYIAGVTDWAKANGASKFFVRWQAPKGSEPVGARASAAFAVGLIAGEEILQALHQVSPKIVQALMGTVTATISALEDHPLQRTVSQVRERVISTDESLRPTLYGSLTQGAHLEPYILDAVRKKIKTGAWNLNQKGSRLHWGSDGLFLAWPIGGREILAAMRDQGVQGIPAHESTLLDMMLSAGILSMGAGNQPYHMVFPVHGEECGDSKICAVRFTRDLSALGMQEGVTKASWGLVLGKLQESQDGNQAASKTLNASPSQQPAAETASHKSTPSRLTKEQKTATNPLQSQEAPQDPPSQAQPGAIEGTASSEAITKTPSPAPSEPGSSIVPSQSETKTSQATAGKRRGASIPEVPEVKVDVESIPPDIVGAVGMEVSREIVVWRDAWNGGRAAGNFALIEGDAGGLAIRLKFINDNTALEVTRLVEPLKKNGFLASEETPGGQRKVLRKVVFREGADQELAYVLKRAIAGRCGFVLDNARK